MAGVQIGPQRVDYPDGSGYSLDKVDGFRRWGPDGVDLEIRPLTRDELDRLVSLEQAADQELSASGLRSQASAAVTANKAFLALALPTQAQALAQVQALTRQVNVMIRLIGADLTNG